MIENFLTTEQVAKILQVHPFTILKFIKEGKLGGVKLGRVYRIKESEVVRFLEDRSVGSTSQRTQNTLEQEAQKQPLNPIPTSKPLKIAGEHHAEFQIPQENELFDLNRDTNNGLHYKL